MRQVISKMHSKMFFHISRSLLKTPMITRQSKNNIDEQKGLKVFLLFLYFFRGLVLDWKWFDQMDYLWHRPVINETDTVT